MLVLLSYLKLQMLPPQCILGKELNVWVKERHEPKMCGNKKKKKANGQGHSLVIVRDRSG